MNKEIKIWLRIQFKLEERKAGLSMKEYQSWYELNPAGNNKDDKCAGLDLCGYKLQSRRLSQALYSDSKSPYYKLDQLIDGQIFNKPLCSSTKPTKLHSIRRECIFVASAAQIFA